MSETSEREKCSRPGNKLWQMKKKKIGGQGGGEFRLYLQKLESRKKKKCRLLR